MSGDPPCCGDAVLGRGGEGRLGRQPVIDRHDWQIEHACHLGAQRLVRVDVTDDEPAAVEEHYHRPRPALLARIVQPRINLPHAAADAQVAQHRHFANIDVAELAHRLEPGARDGRLELMDRGPSRRGHCGKKSFHIVTNEGIGHIFSFVGAARIKAASSSPKWLSAGTCGIARLKSPPESHSRGYCEWRRRRIY
jgi:hypothetical protein